MWWRSNLRGTVIVRPGKQRGGRSSIGITIKKRPAAFLATGPVSRRSREAYIAHCCIIVVRCYRPRRRTTRLVKTRFCSSAECSVRGRAQIHPGTASRNQVQDEANHTAEFHVGTTAWSWGYNMELTVTALDESHSRVVIGISRSGGKAVSWGSGKKEVLKIFNGIATQLAEKPTAQQ